MRIFDPYDCKYQPALELLKEIRHFDSNMAFSVAVVKYSFR